MAEVWKFKLGPMDNTIEMPLGARVLSAAFQGEDLQIWAAVDPCAENGARMLRVVGTGHPAPDLDGAFVGTVFWGALVFHVFDYGYLPQVV